MGTLASQSSVNMIALLVFAALSAVSVADDAPAAPAVLPYLGYGYGLGAYPYALASPLTYTYTPQVTKFVPKGVPVEVKHIQYGIAETGCHNHFGFSVPCLREGEARKKRSADEEAAAAPVVLPYGGFGYAGFGYPYTYGAYPYAHPAVKVAEPVVTEVEVPHVVYKPVVEKVDLAPACHNGAGWPVPCAKIQHCMHWQVQCCKDT